MSLSTNKLKKMDTICKNKYLSSMDEDVFYHFGFSSRTIDMVEAFGDVKFVIVGGSSSRIEFFAHKLQKDLKAYIPFNTNLRNIAELADRFVLYKVGPVLLASHGMGVPSMSICLHELIKMIEHSNCKDVIFFRFGTSGGLGIAPGSVVISNACLNTQLEEYLELNILGKTVKRTAKLDPAIIAELLNIAKHLKKDYEILAGGTMCANDFYEEQCRSDGAICLFSEEEKMAYLKKIQEKGVLNIEMESVGFGAICHMLNIKGSIVCVTLVNRFISDQITATNEELSSWKERPAELITEFIKSKLNK